MGRETWAVSLWMGETVLRIAGWNGGEFDLCPLSDMVEDRGWVCCLEGAEVQRASQLRAQRGGSESTSGTGRRV